MTRLWKAPAAVVGLLLVHVGLAWWGCWAVLTAGADGLAMGWLAAWALVAVGTAAFMLRGWRRWGWGLRAGLLGALGLLAVDGGLMAWPQRAALLPMPVGTPLQATVQGRALVVQGDWQRGDGARVAALLRQQPALVRLQLQGGGLALSEGAALADLMAERKLDTQAVGPCEQACALVFFQGKRRHLLPGAQLGLARLPEPTGHPIARWWMRSQLQSRFEAAGVPTGLQQSALHTSAATRAWFAAGPLWSVDALTQAREPLDVDLPLTPGDAVAEYAQALAAHPVWQSLEQRFPGLGGQVAQRMHAVRGQQVTNGAGPEARDEATWQAAREAAYARLPALLQDANGVERLRYAALVGEMAAAAPDAQVCWGLFGPDAQARRQLPPEALGAEARWMRDVSTQAAEPPKPLKPLEQEVLRRSLGAAAAADWARLWRAESQGAGLNCRSARALLARVQALPVPQRALAARAML